MLCYVYATEELADLMQQSWPPLASYHEFIFNFMSSPFLSTWNISISYVLTNAIICAARAKASCSGLGSAAISIGGDIIGSDNFFPVTISNVEK
jgi:hypothetical protein